MGSRAEAGEAGAKGHLTFLPCASLIPPGLKRPELHHIHDSESVIRSVVSALCDSMDCSLCPWGSPGKTAGVGCHALLQGIFPTQGLNLGLLHSGTFFTHQA